MEGLKGRFHVTLSNRAIGELMLAKAALEKNSKEINTKSSKAGSASAQITDVTQNSVSSAATPAASIGTTGLGRCAPVGYGACDGNPPVYPVACGDGP